MAKCIPETSITTTTAPISSRTRSRAAVQAPISSRTRSATARVSKNGPAKPSSTKTKGGAAAAKKGKKAKAKSSSSLSSSSAEQQEGVSGTNVDSPVPEDQSKEIMETCPECIKLYQATKDAYIAIPEACAKTLSIQVGYFRKYLEVTELLDRFGQIHDVERLRQEVDLLVPADDISQRLHTLSDNLERCTFHITSPDGETEKYLANMREEYKGHHICSLEQNIMDECLGEIARFEEVLQAQKEKRAAMEKAVWADEKLLEQNERKIINEWAMAAYDDRRQQQPHPSMH